MANAPKPNPSKPKGSRFVLRPYRRVPTHRVLYYLSGKCVGKGVVTNLSQSGMRVRGEHEVEPGLDLALRLTLSDDGPTIDIDRATVRWVDGFCASQPVSKEAHQQRVEPAGSRSSVAGLSLFPCAGCLWTMPRPFA
jgi:hypothetical protein